MSIDAKGEFLITVAAAVLEVETSDPRFETFARSVVSELEGGAVILSTSASWDLGRDGVGFGSARGIYICASLRDDVDAKALSDIMRLTSRAREVTRLYFCSSHPLSEHRRDLLEVQLASEVENRFPVTCLGASQLCEVAAQHPHLLERHYGAEIQDVIKTIKADAADETETRGLRLAIMTAAADESAEIRAEIYCTGLLDALKDGQKKTAVGCAKQLSADLRLRRTISVEAILPYLARLACEGHISDSGDLYTITDSGVGQIERREQDAAKRLVEGRQAIRNAIEAELGSRLANDQFLKIWSVFEERMVHYFTSRGDSIVAEVSAVLGDDGEQHIEDDLRWRHWTVSRASFSAN